jgi:3-deoxy-D-manno-octulosonic-acid transferase
VQLRSAAGGGPLQPGEVLIVDTVGELGALYERGVAAFVGGTLVPVGGHNVLEPVLAGRPVLHGPHVDNVRHAVELLAGSGAARAVADADALAAALADWFGDLPATRALGERGRAALAAHRGSTERSLALIEATLAREAV